MYAMYTYIYIIYIYRLYVCTEIIDREIEGKIYNHANPDGTGNGKWYAI